MKPTLPDNLGELRKTDVDQYAKIIEKYINDLQDCVLELQKRQLTTLDELNNWWDFAHKIITDDTMTIEQARELVKKMVIKWAP